MMNFDEIVVKESPGLCRCCLSEGCYKDMGTEYSWMTETEVYADMLLECFDISISQHSEGPNGPNRLICEVCITRLRDACNFKKQVVDSEKRFIDMLARGEFKQQVMIYQTQPQSLKEEHLQDKSDPDGEVEYLEDVDFDDIDDIPLTKLPSEPSSSEQAKPSRKRGRPKKSTTEQVAKKTDKPKVKVNRGDSSGSLGSTDSQETPEPVTISKTGPSLKEKRQIMRKNVTQVLINSTLMPFRWLKSSYRCFYCYEIFQETAALKNHTLIHTGDQIIVETMNKYWENVVFVDVSNISCKLCIDTVTDLHNLVDHLIDKHNMEYNKDVGIGMVGFKLNNNNVSCLVCEANFYTFGPLLHHTNKDHNDASATRIHTTLATKLCDICGQQFKHKVSLRLHVKTIHQNNGHLCSECGEKFESRAKLLTHQKKQHNRSYKCLVCTEVFESHYKRSRHMVAEHKNRPEIKCPHCPKVFVFRSIMMNHVRDTHLKERNHVCGVCGFRAYNNTRLKNHMFKHSGEKNFKCEGCDKAFTTKKIMRAHYIRMHKPRPMLPFDDQYIGPQGI